MENISLNIKKKTLISTFTIDEFNHRNIDYVINIQFWHVFIGKMLADLECKIVVMSSRKFDGIGTEYIISLPAHIDLAQVVTLAEVQSAIKMARNDITTNEYQRYIDSINHFPRLIA